MAKQAPESDLQRLHVEFLTSAPSRRECPPEDEPEIAVAGRSNAGKSSVLNRITGSRRTAKVSKTPGRTQLLNFFSVRGGGRIVDLPGYGYAKSNLAAQKQWQASVNDYLSNRDALAALILVMDIRHPLQSLDEELLAWSGASGIPTLVLLNKADKLKRGAQAKQMALVRKRCGADLLCFSASNGLGNDEAIAWLQPILESGVISESLYGEPDIGSEIDEDSGSNDSSPEGSAAP